MDELDKIFKNANTTAKENFEKVSFQYTNSYSIAGLDSLREEICICLTFNLFQAAITLTNHLFENGFKTLLIYFDFYKNKTSDSDIIDEMDALLDKYDNKKLTIVIEKIFQNKIIDEIEKTHLIELKNKYRNPFSHAEKRKIYGDEKSVVEEFKFGEEGIYIEKQEHLKSNLLPFHDVFQKRKAKEESFQYFVYIDNIIRKSYYKIVKNELAGA